MPLEDFRSSDGKDGGQGPGPLAEKFWGGGDGPRPPMLREGGNRHGGNGPQPEMERQGDKPGGISPELERNKGGGNFPQLELVPNRVPPPVNSGTDNSMFFPATPGDPDKPKIHSLNVRDYLTLAGITGSIVEGGKHLWLTSPLRVEPGAASKLIGESGGTISGAGRTSLGALERGAVATAETKAAQAGATFLDTQLASRMAVGAGKAIFIAGGSILAGKVLDNALGLDTSHNGTARLVMDGLVVPSILISALPTQQKLLYAGGVFCASRAIDYLTADRKTPGTWDTTLSRMGEDAHRNPSTMDFSSLLVPNACDAVLLPAAAIALPAQYKIAGIAAAYGAGRLLNAARYHMNPNYSDMLVKPKI